MKDEGHLDRFDRVFGSVFRGLETVGEAVAPTAIPEEWLRKLAEKAAPFPGASRATQHLFIVNPVQTITARTPALLATHPDIADRIARLRNLGG